jgi:drug/metabolite transporter (DMT)-like permease
LEGSLFMLGSAFFFSLMTVFVKLAGQNLASQQIVLVRALVGLVLSYAIARQAGVSIWGNNRSLLVARGLVGFSALSCFFYAITRLPLAEATVIQSLYPSATALAAAVWLREALDLRVVLASALSVGGVVLVARPGSAFDHQSSGLDPTAVAVAVTGALLTAVAYVLVRRLSTSEHPAVIIFYFPLVCVPATLPLAWMSWVWPTAWEWAVLLGVGVTTQIAQMCLTRGIALLPAGRATALSYLQVVFAMGWATLWFAESPDSWTLLGAALVALGTLSVALR